MKIILFYLSFYLILNFISGFDTLNVQPHHQENNASNTNHPASHFRFQRSKYPPQHSHPIINGQEVNPKFRPWFQIERNSTTEPSFLDASNSNISSILNNNIQLNHPHLADEKATLNTTKLSNLLQMFTPRTQLQERVSSASYYFQQKLKQFFFGHQNDKFPSRNYSHIKTGL